MAKITCLDCLHAEVCEFTTDDKYESIEQLKDDCDHFIGWDEIEYRPCNAKTIQIGRYKPNL